MLGYRPPACSSSCSVTTSGGDRTRTLSPLTAKLNPRSKARRATSRASSRAGAFESAGREREVVQLSLQRGDQVSGFPTADHPCLTMAGRRIGGRDPFTWGHTRRRPRTSRTRSRGVIDRQRPAVTVRVVVRPDPETGRIHLVGLSKTYPTGTVALRSIHLDVAPGEFVGLLGPSGAGKSTLLRCVNGLVRPSAGQVRVDGLVVDGDESGASTAAPARGDDLPAVQPGRPALRARERADRPPLLPPGAPDAPAALPAGGLRAGDGLPPARGPGRPGGPAGGHALRRASASGSRSRGRWPRIPGSCSRTSRWRAWIPGRPTRCWS